MTSTPNKPARTHSSATRPAALLIALIVALSLVVSPLLASARAEGRSAPQAQTSSVPLYGLFDLKVTNSKSYSNPYDYRVVELQTKFTAPSGKQYSFFGFYDGDGNGGLKGNVWRMRFMPNETGRWTYTYTWSDGSAGGSGSFDVNDTGLPGPLQVAKDNSWYFETARGKAFDWRGYSLHRYLHWKYGRGVYTDAAWSDLQDKIKTKVAGRSYNAVMLRWPTITRRGENGDQDNAGNHFWQQSGTTLDFTRFYIPQWRKLEQTLQVAADQRVYVFQFVALVDQETPRPKDDQMPIFLRYMAARLGAYWNNFGYSATWEYADIWSNSTANTHMSRLHDNLKGLPNHQVVTIHDHSNNAFTGWLDFSMRQQGSRSVFDGNCRSCGQHGGVGSEFTNKPVVGSEDIWEDEGGGVNMPRNGTEVRRGAWGGLLAGAMPVYMENTGSSGTFNGEGEPEVRRMWDFYFSKTSYRQYKMLNSLVESGKGQICSGITGKEYLVYDQDGGTINLNLSGASSATSFSVLWYNPANASTKDGGTVSGGATRSLSSPFSGDTVLLLKASSSPQPTATQPPAPTATQPPAPTATQPPAPTKTPVPTATQPPAPTATQPPAPTQPPTATPPAPGTVQPNVTIRVNFQRADSDTPAGFLADDGSPFGQRGGWKYGWSGGNEENARDRIDAPNYDPVLCTLNHLQKTGDYAWDVEVPNGRYQVRVVSGDPNAFDSLFKIQVEDVVVVDGAPSDANRWVEGTAVVTVKDGRLTLRSAAGAQNNKVNLIEFTLLPDWVNAPVKIFLPLALRR